MEETKALSQDISPVKLYVSSTIKDTLGLLCAKNTEEWTLFGKTVFNKDFGGLELVDFYVPKQSNSRASTEVEEDAIETMMDEKEDDMEGWNVWIHSHNTLGAFWSGTDLNQMQEFGTKYSMPFVLSIVVTSAGETFGYKGRLSMFRPFPCEMEVQLITIYNSEKYQTLQVELKKKTIERPAVSYTTPYKAWSKGKWKNYEDIDELEEDPEFKALSKKKREKSDSPYKTTTDGAKDSVYYTLEESGFIIAEKNAEIVQFLEDEGMTHYYSFDQDFVKKVRNIYGGIKGYAEALTNLEVYISSTNHYTE